MEIYCLVCLSFVRQKKIQIEKVFPFLQALIPVQDFFNVTWSSYGDLGDLGKPIILSDEIIYFSCCCEQIPGKKQLKGRGFILATIWG